MKRENLALRPYIERIEKICAGLKKQELVALIVNMAGEEAPARRHRYLTKIMEHLPSGSSGEKHPDIQGKQSLFDELQGLKESIHARIDSIEDGTYWDDPDYDGEEDYYNDEELDYLSEDHQDDLVAFFDMAGEYFLQNRLAEAKVLYKALFSLIGEIGEYNMPDIEVDIREAHARYCRTIYEEAQSEERVREMAKAMDISQPRNDFDNLREGDMALFQDVIDAQVGELPDMADFLPQWEKFLVKEGHVPDRLARLRVEAALMINGLAGVQKLAQSWKEKQPIGYLSWMEHLARSEKWPALRDAATEALAVLPIGQDRRYAAGYLVKYGYQCGNDDFVLQGRREAFRSSANAPNLLHLIAVADRQQVRQEELSKAITILQKGNYSDYYLKPLLAKLFLMAGDLKSLADFSKGGEVYGWSGGSPSALLFCAVLYCNSNRNKHCILINRLLLKYTDDSVYFDSNPMNDETPTTTFLEQITIGLDKIDNSKDDFKQYIEPSLQKGQKRVEYIVSNKYRKAYDRAAQTLGAMAEMLVAQGKKQQAKKLLHRYYFQLYSRYPAFRREVLVAVNASPLLVGMGVK